MSLSQCRQNFHDDVEAGINRHINLELWASYSYMSKANFFERDDHALYGLVKYFKQKSDEKLSHARKMMAYQNMRGGKVVFKDIKEPDDVWDSALSCMMLALKMEKHINTALIDLHNVGGKYNDNQFQHFIKHDFLNEQVRVIKEIGDHVTNLKRVGPGLGEFIFDKETLGGSA